MAEYSPRQWNKDFADWTKNNPATAAHVKDILGDKQFRDYETGRIFDLNSLNPHTRAVLYKTTQLEILKFESYFDPDSVKLREILDGTTSRAALPIWLGSKGISKTSLAEDSDVDRKTVRAFIENAPIRGQGHSKILATLRKYANKYEPVNSVQNSPEPSEESSLDVARGSRSDLDVLAGEVARLNESVQSLGGRAQVDESAWRARGTYAVDLLARVMDHYASAPAETRKAFVEQLKKDDLVSVFGWCGNIFSGLLKEDGSPDVFARNFRPRNIGRRE